MRNKNKMLPYLIAHTVESAESASPYSVRGMASSGAMTAESRVSTISDTLRFNNDMRSPHYAPVVVEVCANFSP